jgi:hypothetical protein
VKDFRRVAGPLSFTMWLVGMAAYEHPGAFFGLMIIGSVSLAGVAFGSYVLDKLSGVD